MLTPTSEVFDELRILARDINPAADRHLRRWASVDRCWRPNIGYPDHSPGFATGGGRGDDASDYLADSAEGYSVSVTEDVLDTLQPQHRMVLTSVYLVAVFRCRPGTDLAELLREALVAFWGKAQGWGLV